MMELEIESGEIIYKDELCGNSLLINEYFLNNPNKNKNNSGFDSTLKISNKYHIKTPIDNLSKNSELDEQQVKKKGDSTIENNENTFSPRLQFSLSEPRPSTANSNKSKHSLASNNFKRSEIYKDNKDSC